MISTAPLAPESFLLRRRDFVPAYLRLGRARLLEKVERALEELRRCRVCPRNCDVDRLEGKTAVCRTGRHARVGSHFAHFGEEDCLRGTNGSARRVASSGSRSSTARSTGGRGAARWRRRSAWRGPPACTASTRAEARRGRRGRSDHCASSRLRVE